MPRPRSQTGLVSWYGMLSRALGAAGLTRCQTTSLDAAAEGAHPASGLPHDTLVLAAHQAENIRLAQVQSVQCKPTLEMLAHVDVDQARELPLFPPFSGRILSIAVQAGDAIRKGQALYTVDCPDFVSAQSVLISAAETLQLTSAAIDHAGRMLAIGVSAQLALEQAKADYRKADAAFNAARSALETFGLGGAEVVRLIEARQPGTALLVRSPANGIVASCKAAPGDFVQPGSSPAPLTVTDTSLKWMSAHPDDSELAGLQLGQAVRVKVQAYPDRNFGGSIAGIASSPDPENRRAVVCAEVRDPDNLLHPRMTATFTIDTGPAVTELAVPADAVVADGKNTMTVFVTSDGRSFTRRTIRTGAECGNMRVVLSGVLAGEQVAAEGAIFLSRARARQ